MSEPGVYILFTFVLQGLVKENVGGYSHAFSNVVWLNTDHKALFDWQYQGELVDTGKHLIPTCSDKDAYICDYYSIAV
jgi:hypothetical protein